MSAQDFTYRRLRQQPFADVRRTLITIYDLDHLSLAVGNICAKDQATIKSSIESYGWTYEEFAAELKIQANQHMQEFATRFKERMDQLK